MKTDAIGRIIKAGDVCGFASRRGSSLELEPLIVREVTPKGVKGDKIVRESGEIFLSLTHWIKRTDHLIVVGITEQEVLSLMQVRKSKDL